MFSAFHATKITNMLKKVGIGLLYLALMMGLGFCIYFFFLNPDQTLLDKSPNNRSTDHFFSTQLIDVHGKSYTLNQFQGKIVVVNFWATWCAPCREEMPELSRFYDAYKNKNAVVLGIAIDEPDAVNTFQTETPVTYPIFASESEGMLLAESLGNHKGVLPFTLIIDQHGNIAKSFFGKVNFSTLSAEILHLLAQRPLKLNKP